MKNSIKVATYSILILFTTLIFSCVSVGHNRRPGPPPPRVEVIPAAPSSRHVWHSGSYRWKRNKYVWHEGRYRKGH